MIYFSGTFLAIHIETALPVVQSNRSYMDSTEEQGIWSIVLACWKRIKSSIQRRKWTLLGPCRRGICSSRRGGSIS